MKFADLGEQVVKNIARPIRVFKVIFDRREEPELPASIRRVGGDEDEVGSSEEAPDSDSVEIAFWQSVQSSDKEPEYELYLERYPDGAFAELAKARLQNAKATDDPNIELAYWETVRESGEAEMLKAYLEKYPQGQFISLASIMLDKLENATG